MIVQLAISLSGAPFGGKPAGGYYSIARIVPKCWRREVMRM